MLKTEQILNAKFTPVSKGTYSAEEVDAFLKTVADSYEQSLNENRELIKKISILADKIESYRSDEEAIKLSLLDAHRMAETVNKNAKDKADNLVAEAEGKSKIILDGANRQSSQIIEEAREKAKEIVDNARTAVASLTDRAQKETDLAIASARTKSAEIISKAEEKGNEIIGTSKQSYEFYSSELAKLKSETEKFKALISDICNNQLSLINDIPEVVLAAPAVAEEAEEAAVEAETAEEILDIPEPEEAAQEEVAQEIAPEVPTA
ncbi:MAG: DivIVA domain-containing protein, partial [Clostridia bacterium]|nr:DivIVA domain-containing protein [Clostridia bacterium]